MTTFPLSLPVKPGPANSPASPAANGWGGQNTPRSPEATRPHPTGRAHLMTRVGVVKQKNAAQKGRSDAAASCRIRPQDGCRRRRGGSGRARPRGGQPPSAPRLPPEAANRRPPAGGARKHRALPWDIPGAFRRGKALLYTFKTVICARSTSTLCSPKKPARQHLSEQKREFLGASGGSAPTQRRGMDVCTSPATARTF